VEANELIAIKKVLQDKRFKNRELQIMRKLDHCNIVKLKYFFYTSGDKVSSHIISFSCVVRDLSKINRRSPMACLSYAYVLFHETTLRNMNTSNTYH